MSETVLITGASGGIGLEFAKVFAENGFDVVLVARNKDKLDKTARALTETYKVKAYAIQADLSCENGAKEVYEAVTELGIAVDQLVNNAGAGKAGRVVDTEPDEMRKLINLNAVSVTMLCHYFGKDMAKRGRGRILNVSSLGAFIPDPYFNVYGPTKAFELFLSEAMYGEMKKSGVSVSVLCPGPTKTNWAKNAGKADSKTALSPVDVAKAGFKGMQAGKLVIVPTLTFKLERFAMGLLPAKVKSEFIARWQNSLISSNKGR